MESKMQASKMKVGELYAIHRGNTLTAFKVTSVDSHRTADKTYSTIRGNVFDVVTNQIVGAELNYDPQDFEGPYVATKAEMDAKAARDAERQATAKRAEQRADAILKAFAIHFGVPVPKRVREYGSWRYPNNLPFRLDYSDKIEVTRDGMEILAAFFKVDVELEVKEVVNFLGGES